MKLKQLDIMKNTIKLTTLLLIIVHTSWSQTDIKAKKILDALSKKYRSYNIVKSDFSYTLDNPQAKIKESKNGILIVKPKQNKYKVIIDGREVFCDGKAVYNYTKDENEIQIDNIDKNSKSISPSKIFTLYEDGFKCLFTGEDKKAYYIELSPISPNTTYFKIKLSINKQNQQVQDITVLDKNGSRYTYKVKSFNSTPKITDDVFNFDKKHYKDVDIVDLR